MIPIYTDRLIPKGSGGFQSLCFILIRPQYRHDRGILEHERKHWVQWFMLGVVVSIVVAALADMLGFPMWWGAVFGISAHGLVYRFVKRYRLYAEVAAYREQMQWTDSTGINRLTAESAARRLIKPNYRFGLTYDQALRYFQ